jgi:hypothetical protein
MADLTGAAVLTKRCNPYGNATDAGPRRLLGGVYGPEYEGRYKWGCQNPATIRARAACEYGHRGQPMDLCVPHAREMQKRQMGLCPPCAWPPEALQWNEVIERSQNELAVLHARGQFHSARGVQLRAYIESAGHRMTELHQSGRIKNTPLTLTEIS